MFLPTHSSEDRLRVWREFRKNFSSTGTEQDVVSAFASVKLQNRYLDYYTPESWPNVFDIVAEGYFCQTGLTLVIASTLQYFGFTNKDNLKFVMISNNITGADGAVLVHDDRCFNFLPGEIVTLEYAKSNSVLFDTAIITPDKLFG